MLIFFGYTHCPDVCPTGLQVMSTAIRRLGPLAERIRPVFISLDPARDTPEVLRRRFKRRREPAI
ncbi:MAG: SCO family protein [bacterium]|nr:SCO family protein [bacterium]